MFSDEMRGWSWAVGQILLFGIINLYLIMLVHKNQKKKRRKYANLIEGQEYIKLNEEKKNHQ